MRLKRFWILYDRKRDNVKLVKDIGEYLYQYILSLH